MSIYEEIFAIASGAPFVSTEPLAKPAVGYETLSRALESITTAFVAYLGLSQSDPRWGYTNSQDHAIIKTPITRVIGQYTIVDPCLVLLDKDAAVQRWIAFPVSAIRHTEASNDIIVGIVDSIAIVDMTDPNCGDLFERAALDLKRLAAGYARR